MCYFFLDTIKKYVIIRVNQKKKTFDNLTKK